MYLKLSDLRGSDAFFVLLKSGIQFETACKMPLTKQNGLKKASNPTDFINKLMCAL